MHFPKFLDDSSLPEGIQTLPLCVVLSDPHQGSALVRFTLDTRHFCTELPHNERKSYRIILEWLVVSRKRGRAIGILTQSDHSYRHPDLVVELPLDSDLILVPASPYICNAAPAVSAAVSGLSLGAYIARYVYELGASTDSGIVGDNWSYREGRLDFEHWFHNKMFRWSFDNAELVLPASPGRALWIGMNALCRTGVDVFVADHKVGHLHPITNWARWHDEFYGFAVPASLVTGYSIRLQFRYTGANDGLIDFNLRQSYFAVSRITVDVFGEADGGLLGRVTAAGWHRDQPLLEPDPRDGCGSERTTTQAAIVVPQIEFDLLDRFFAPHSTFWTTLRGAIKGFCDAGVSAAIVSDAALRPAAYDTLVLGPVRFVVDAVDRPFPPGVAYKGALFTMTIASLRRLGLAVDDSLLQKVEYKEVFDVPLPSGRRGNFWEFVLSESIFCQAVFGWGDIIMLGRVSGSDTLWLITAAAEESIEMGDPHSAEVLAEFVAGVAAKSFGLAGDVPCTFQVVGDDLEMDIVEHQVGLRSYGGGIARGWPAVTSEVALFSAKRRDTRFVVENLPHRGDVARALRAKFADLAGLRIATGTKLRVRLGMPNRED